jgi:hypothetical protein
MVLGMSLATYTAVHVIISLIGIASGFIVLFGLLTGRLFGLWNSLFLITTVLTSVTGFGFPNTKVTPGIVLGVLSLIALAIAIFALYARHLSGAWRRTYAITAMIALYFNVFVLIAQLFEKVPAFHALAPTQTEGALQSRAASPSSSVRHPHQRRSQKVPACPGIEIGSRRNGAALTY